MRLSHVRSLAALDLAMSPVQVSELQSRIAASTALPRLNALGESMSQARLLNTEERVRQLFELQDKKKEALLAKTEKRKERAKKSSAKLVQRLQKQHAKDVQQATEKPLIEVLHKAGYIPAADCKPTVSVLRTFAKQQGMKPNARSRADLVQWLLASVKTANSSPANVWIRADEECKEQESSDSDNSEPATPQHSSDDESDVDNWEDFQIRC